MDERRQWSFLEVPAAWIFAFLIRLVAFMTLWAYVIPETTYTNFTDNQLTTSLGVPEPPLYAWIATLLWSLALRNLHAFILLHLAIHALAAPLVLMICYQLRLSRPV